MEANREIKTGSRYENDVPPNLDWGPITVVAKIENGVVTFEAPSIPSTQTPMHPNMRWLVAQTRQSDETKMLIVGSKHESLPPNPDLQPVAVVTKIENGIVIFEAI